MLTNLNPPYEQSVNRTSHNCLNRVMEISCLIYDNAKSHNI